MVIGARSSVFLPFSSLGLVIVDEEHESAYKQHDPAPRYNARDAAIVLASMHGAKTLLGSATPSIETYYKATTGRFGLVSLTERFEGMQLPEMRLIDMSDARKKGLVTGTFAFETERLVNESLKRGEQSILLSIVADMHRSHAVSCVAMCLNVTIVMCRLHITDIPINSCVIIVRLLIQCLTCVPHVKSRV